MGQKVNPHGLRVGVIKDWDSRWFAGKATFGDTLVEDYKIRDYLMNKRMFSKVSGEKTGQLLSRAVGIADIQIERTGADKIKIYIHADKVGMLIGPKGAEIEKIRGEVEKLIGKTVSIDIVEIKNPDLNAQLVADSIAQQLEGRVSFRRAMKQAIGRTMKSGAKGIKTMVSGRLGGAEIARSESYHEGTIPLQTLRADIEYGVARANTTYGVIGVKVWIYNGEVLKGEIPANKPARTDRNERGDRRRNDRANGAGRNGDRRPPRKPRTEAKKEGGNE
ncbi:MAG TPA: 30S ribosomal protein S3 [Ruminococcaceae bacterium]|nr:30S ribosomal protein S3 [Oscillospiraceae bacterium]